MFEHEGRPHIWLGESRLREAIKALVAKSGHPAVLLDRYERERQERVKRATQLAKAEDGDAPPD